MDILKTITVNVNLYAKKDINLIILLKLTVKKFAHGTIFIKDSGISVWVAHRTVFGSLVGKNADAMVDMKKSMAIVFPFAKQVMSESIMNASRNVLIILTMRRIGKNVSVIKDSNRTHTENVFQTARKNIK